MSAEEKRAVKKVRCVLLFANIESLLCPEEAFMSGCMGQHSCK